MVLLSPRPHYSLPYPPFLHASTPPSTSPLHPLQEIPLSEVLEVRPAGDFTLVPPGTRPHCFEIITGTMCYFVGEDPNMHAPTHSSLPQGSPPTPPSPSNVAPNSGVGREVAKAWESAIRQALMPVIFQDAPPAEGHTPHSKGRV